ncbi:hemolysin, partial [Serratia marcescens]
MAYVITDREKLQAIWEAAKAGDWPAVYAASVDALTDPNHANQPIQGVDIAVYTWIKGAYGVNSNQGAFAHYIRDQTKLQYELRTGHVPDDWETRIQNASDNIAKNFAKTLFGVDLSSDPNAPLPDAPPTSAKVPDIHEVGLIDAGAAASEVFTDASSTGAPNYSPWAGTTLFSYLGDTSFFTEWVATNDTSPFKIESGTYDLIAAAQVSMQMKNLSYVVETLLAGEVPTYLTTLGIGHETIRLAAEAARDFYTESYGSSVTGGGSIIPGKLDIGSAIFNDIADVLSTPNLYRVGTLYDDDFTLAFGNIAVNTGSGDDTISVPRGWQNNAGNYGWTVIDGGSGHDTVDYSSLSHGVNLKFDAQGSYGGRGVVEKNGIGLYGFKDGLYNIEAVKLTDFKDNVTFNDRVLTPANGLEVNLGKGSSEIRFEHGYTTAPGGSAPQDYLGVNLSMLSNDVPFPNSLLNIPVKQTHNIYIDDSFELGFL